MKVLVTGGKGLLAHAIRELNPAGMELVFWDVEEFDLTSPESMVERLERLRPDCVINTAAYNLVERCEVERDLSWAVNALGPGTLAQICAANSWKMVHFSSDYVFDGARMTPYEEIDAPNPLNHYGKGKLYGEQAVLRASPANIVFRTSWLFGLHPTQSKTYVHAVLRQAIAGKPIKAAFDQVSVPTFAPDLARIVVDSIVDGVGGLFHAVNNEGVSRYDWTVEILEEAKNSNLIGKAVPLEGVPTSYFGSTMPRPSYSVLSNRKISETLGISQRSWREGVGQMVRQLVKSRGTL